MIDKIVFVPVQPCTREMMITHDEAVKTLSSLIDPCISPAFLSFLIRVQLLAQQCLHTHKEAIISFFIRKALSNASDSLSLLLHTEAAAEHANRSYLYL